MPPIELSADDRAGMSPAEIEALTGANAESQLAQIGDTAAAAAPAAAPAPAASTDPEDDPDAAAAATLDKSPEGDDGGKPAAEATTDPNTDADTLTQEELAAIVADATSAPPPAAPQPLRVEQKDFTALRTAIDDRIDDVEKKWGAGSMTDEERIKELRVLRGEMSALDREQARAETLAEVNSQTVEMTFAQAATEIAKQAKADGTIDYGDPKDRKAAVLFDAQLTLLNNDPDNAGKSPLELAQAAHRAVLAIRGVTPKAAAPAPAPAAAPAAPAAPKPREVVQTLTGLPNAGMAGATDDIAAKLATLEGEDLEEALAALPKATVDAYMRQADSTAMGFAKGSGTRRNQASAATAA